MLNRNTPSVEPYEAAGAVPVDEWTVFRLTDAALTAFRGRPPRASLSRTDAGSAGSAA